MTDSLEKVVIATFDPSFSVPGRVYRAAYQGGVEYFGLEGLQTGVLDVQIDGDVGRAYLNDVPQHEFYLDGEIEGETALVRYNLVKGKNVKVLEIDHRPILDSKAVKFDLSGFKVSENTIKDGLYRIRPKKFLGAEGIKLEEYPVTGKVSLGEYFNNGVRVSLVSSPTFGELPTVDLVFRTFHEGNNKDGRNFRAAMRRWLRLRTNILDHYCKQNGTKIPKKEISRYGRYHIPLDIAHAAQRYFVDGRIGFVRI